METHGDGGRSIPFTPFHLGPGLLAKAIVPRCFWLTSFLVANVLIDVEVLLYLWRDDPPIHRYLHTYLGGTCMGVVAGVLMLAAFHFIRRVMPGHWRWAKHLALMPPSRLLAQSLAAGVFGGVLHVLLDSLMHGDMQPFWPIAEGNRLVGVVGVGTLHMACAATGFLGLATWLCRRER